MPPSSPDTDVWNFVYMLHRIFACGSLSDVRHFASAFRSFEIYDMLKYSPFLRHGEREVESERGRESEANIPNFREGVRTY